MKRFRFSLQSVATLRSLKELRAKEHLAAAIRALEQATLTRAKARAERAELERIMRDGRAATTTAVRHVASLDALAHACLAETAAEKALATAAAHRDDRVAEYHEAARALKAVTNLEARARDNHRRAREREEQNALDERAGLAAARAFHHLP